MFKNLWDAIKIEVKNAILISWFHIFRFFGLLFIPLIYGFSYVFAFWDPFSKVDRLPVAFVTQTKSGANDDYFGEAVGNVMKNTQTAYIGELSLNLKADHIYEDILDGQGKIDNDKLNDFRNKDMKNYHVAFVMPNLTSEVDNMVQAFINNKLPNQIPSTLTRIDQLFEKLLNDKIQLINNFKKNYLIAFGIDLGASMAGTQRMMLKVILQALNDPIYKNHIESTGIKPEDYENFITNINAVANALNSNNFEFIRTETHMHEHAKYGYGLTPFFVSVAMWVGAMVMTFAVHKRVYSRTVGPVARYYAKWLLIVGGTIIQATILMVSLYLIGLEKLGIGHWFAMYGFAIFTGVVFGTIVQAIRFIIHSRNLGIFLSILILVLQMASAGGLFPIETQAKGYQVLNMILPMGHTVTIYRELAFETRWGVVFTHVGYLLIYPIIFMTAGLLFNIKFNDSWLKTHDISSKYILKKHNRKWGV